MNKKIKYYIFIIIFVLIAENFTYIKNTVLSISSTIFTPKQKISVFTDDEFLSSRFGNNKKLENYKITYKQKDADIIITDKILENNTYEKTSLELYSPIIIANKKGWNVYGVQQNEGYFYVNYNAILKGFLEDKTYKEVGYDINEKIKITIPEENTPYYNDTINAMYYALYGNDYSNENQKEFQTILEKCDKTGNILSSIKQSDDYGCFFIPEFLYNRGYSIDIAYDNESVVHDYNVYIKNALENKNEVLQLFNSFKFYKYFGLRSTSSEYELSYGYVKKIINIAEDKKQDFQDSEINSNEKDDVPIEQENISEKNEESGETSSNNFLIVLMAIGCIILIALSIATIIIFK